MRPPGGAHRNGARCPDQSVVAVRPQELLLRRSTAGLSDFAAVSPDRRRGIDHRAGRRQGRGQRQDHRHRTHPYRAGCGQIDARPASDDVVRRPQPIGGRADGNRVAPRHAFARRSRGLRPKAAIDPALRRVVRRQYGGRLDARRRQRQRAQTRWRTGHANRDQERQFGALRDERHRIGSAAPGRADRERRHRGAGNPPLRSRPQRNPDAAIEGRRPRLPLLPRSRPAPARTER